MTTPFAVSIVPNDIAIFFAIILLVVGGLVWYALRTKGDVRAESTCLWRRNITTVRLNVEENQLVNVFGEFGNCLGDLKSA